MLLLPAASGVGLSSAVRSIGWCGCDLAAMQSCSSRPAGVLPDASVSAKRRLGLRHRLNLSNVPPELGACPAAGFLLLDTWARRWIRRTGWWPGHNLASDYGREDRDLTRNV